MLNSSEAGFTTFVQDRSALKALMPHWQALSERSVEDCAYYAPHVALALLESVAAKTDVRFLTAWSGDRLMAFMPIVPSRVRVPGVKAAGSAWQTDYTFSCTPLLDALHATQAAEALMTALAKLAPAEWIFPDINVDGPAARALVAALDALEAPHRFTGEFERASLDTGLSFEQHMQAHVSSKRRRELARNLRRLQELGKVEFRSATHGPELKDAVQAFLALEASGWKGKRGTALACEPDTMRFAELAFNAGKPGLARADLLLLNGKPLAAGMIVFAGRTGFTVKGAYDETYASHGVGLLLEQEVIRSLLTERWADRLDSATNGSHVIDYLWPSRMKVADLVFSLARRNASRRLDSLISVKSLKERGRSRLKQLLARNR